MPCTRVGCLQHQNWADLWVWQLLGCSAGYRLPRVCRGARCAALHEEQRVWHGPHGHAGLLCTLRVASPCNLCTSSVETGTLAGSSDRIPRQQRHPSSKGRMGQRLSRRKPTQRSSPAGQEACPHASTGWGQQRTAVQVEAVTAQPAGVQRASEQLPQSAQPPQPPQPPQPQLAQSDPQQPCSICFEPCCSEDMSPAGNCRHTFCRACLAAHLAARLQGATFPPRCPHPACPCIMPYSHCCPLLPLLPSAAQEQYLQLLAEWSVPAEQRFYCPSPACSHLLLVERPEPDAPQPCPACHTLVCGWCKAAWHEGASCGEHQALAALRGGGLGPGGEPLLVLAEFYRWQRCPGCSHMIEKSSGCNHMTCRCGWQFCFRCGAAWGPDGATCECDMYEDAPPAPRTPPRALPLAGGPPVAAADAVPDWVPAHRRARFRTRLCRYHFQGRCYHSERCMYAHCAEELRVPHPAGSRVW